MQDQEPNKLRIKALFALVCLVTLALGEADTHATETTKGWSVDKAIDWYDSKPWPVGVNYVPRYAMNQLEMWQAETFDIEVIKEELDWASEVGFNTVRVYLHHLLWQEDSEGLIRRLGEFLDACSAQDISVILVLLDDVWDPNPIAGSQGDPIPRTHNSRWLQSPGKSILGSIGRQDELRDYVQGIVRAFADDERILLWDLYNEPGNINPNSYEHEELPNKPHYSLQLLKRVVTWVRMVNPSQPITIGLWKTAEDGTWFGESAYKALNEFAFASSDVVSFHSYAAPDEFANLHQQLSSDARPLFCTEYMARTTGNTFAAILPYLAGENTGAVSWGLVSGRSQTIYSWDSWTSGVIGEPEKWFHDVFRANGTPFDEEEIKLIGNTITTQGEVK